MSSSSFRIEDDPVWSLCPARRVVNVGCIGFASASKSCFAIDICFQEGYFLDCDTQSVGCHDMTSTKRRHVQMLEHLFIPLWLCLGNLPGWGNTKRRCSGILGCDGRGQQTLGENCSIALIKSCFRLTGLFRENNPFGSSLLHLAGCSIYCRGRSIHWRLPSGSHSGSAH